MKRKLSIRLLSAMAAALLICGCAENEAKPQTTGEESLDDFEEAPVNSTEAMNLPALDLDGNDVNLKDIVSGNKVTMINVWGTFCGPCIEEMPYLAELHEKYKEQGFGIVGLTIDVLDDNDKLINDLVEDGKDIVSETGVTYPILMETSEMKEIFATSAVPASYFVDQNGNQIGKTLIGSRSSEEWEEIINNKLSKVQ